jgi:hypothetical protein
MPPATASPSERVRELFFNEHDILATTECCVRSLSDCCADPITVFGNVAIKASITCTLTTSGLMPFSSDLRILVPFTAMTTPQLQALRHLASDMHGINALRYKHHDGNLTVSSSGDARKVFADAALVLFAVNALVLRAVEGRGVDVSTVINVTQQRIVASLNVHRSQVTTADELTRKYIANRDAAK